jgi:hypothetical protein
MVGASTLQRLRWGLSPYSALAMELNFGNKGLKQCGSLSQGENSESQS